jgi:molecular chaperone GrpE (heat shock protein)
MLLKSNNYPENKSTKIIEGKNIINLRHINDSSITMFSPYLNQPLRLNALFIIIFYHECLESIKNYLFDKKANEDWINTINKIQENNINRLFDSYDYEGGTSSVTMESVFLKDIKELILDLPLIKIVEDENPVNEFSYVENLINDIKNEVKKGNRVSFKLMEELKSTIDALSNHSPNEKEKIDELVKLYKNKAEDFLKLAIDALDMFDVILESAKKVNLTDWSNHIQDVINNFLKSLDSFGIEEIETVGLYFDGGTMISIGTVPQEFAPNLEKYQVYAVHKRGFRFKESGKVIREADVTTIL